MVGYEVVPGFGALDTSTEWLRLEAKKPDVIYVTAYASTLVTLIKDAARLGIMERGVVLCACTTSADEGILRIVGKDGDGWYMPSVLPSAVEVGDIPALKTCADAARKYRNWIFEDVGMWYEVGWFDTMVAVEAVKRAIERVGYENLTGRAVRDTFASLTNVETGIWPPFSMTEEEPWGQQEVRMYIIHEGQLWPRGEWYEAPIYPVELYRKYD